MPRKKPLIKLFTPRELRQNYPMTMGEALQYLPFEAAAFRRKIKNGELGGYIEEGATTDGRRYYTTPRAIEEYVNKMFNKEV